MIKTAILVILPIIFSFSQKVLWQKVYGGGLFDELRAVELTRTGTFICVGMIRSYDADGITKTSADADVWLMKTDIYGNIIWQKNYGGKYNDEATDIAISPNGDYIVVGFTESTELSNGERDFLVMRIDPMGNLIWQKGYGGRGNDVAKTVLALPDGGCLVGGYTGSIDVDVHKNYGGLDFWLIRLDKDGNILWEKNYGGTKNDVLQVILPTQDGNFLLIGSTDSDDKDVLENFGKTDILIIKINPQGYKIWKKTYGGSSFEEPYSGAVDTNDTYWISGTSFSKDGIVKKRHAGGDLWLFKIDGEGNVLFSKTYGGSWDEGGNKIRLTPSGKVLLAGTTRSSDKDITTKNKGLYDGWVVKLDSSYNIEWQITLGGHQSESFYDVIQMPTKDYLFVGFTASKDGDLWTVGGTHGGNDGWLVGVADPEIPDSEKTPPPTSLVGYVLDAETKQKIFDAVIQIVDMDSNKVLVEAKPHPESGHYELQIPDTDRVSIGVLAKGYMFISEEIRIPKNKKHTEIRKDFELQPIKKGANMNLFSIYFDTGKWNLRPESYAELDRLAMFLKMNPTVKIQINGHTDNTGDPSTKKELSLLRAKAVMAYLMKKGIPKWRMKVAGYGMDRPIADNSTPEGRQLNRRVEFVIIDYY